MSEPIRITSKIIGYKVLTNDDEITVKKTANVGWSEVTDLEKMKRPEYLGGGGSFKIKPPGCDHALYLTINSIKVDGITRPYEIFLNSKDMHSFQWVMALTRLVSAVFRKGGDVGYVAQELKEVFDPKGGCFKKGHMTTSIVAEVGECIKTYMYEIGYLDKPEVLEAVKQKREQVV